MGPAGGVWEAVEGLCWELGAVGNDQGEARGLHSAPPHSHCPMPHLWEVVQQQIQGPPPLSYPHHIPARPHHIPPHPYNTANSRPTPTEASLFSALPATHCPSTHLGDVVREHVLNATLECDGRGGAAAARKRRGAWVGGGVKSRGSKRAGGHAARTASPHNPWATIRRRLLRLRSSGGSSRSRSGPQQPRPLVFENWAGPLCQRKA